jgi:hypothetical protein
MTPALTPAASPSDEPRLGRANLREAANALLDRGYQLTLLYGTTPEGICECRFGPGCKSPGKHPRERSWVTRPIRSPDELDVRWEQASGTPNIGIMPDDGLIVIDVDRKKGKRGAETLAALTAEHGQLGHAQQTTPSGGWHFVFRLPPGTDPATLPNRSDVAEGIDVLRAGRQFVATPSQIGARRYTGSLPPRDDLPVLPTQWLSFLQSLGSDGEKERAPTDAAALEGRLAALKAPSVEKVREVVTCIPNPGDTDRGKYMWMAHAIRGACGRDATEEGLDIFTDWAAKWDGTVDPVADERAFVTIRWENVDKGWTDLWRFGARHGYDDTAERLTELQAEFAVMPPSEGVTDPTPPRGATAPLTLHDMLLALHEHLKTISDPLQRDAVRDTRLGRLSQVLHLPFGVLRERLSALDAPHRQVRAQIVRPGPTLRDALSEAPPQALVPGYVYLDQQHVVYGSPQSLKTFTALDLGLHIASGLPWVGRIPVMQRGVVFFAGEAASSLRVRIAAWCAARGVSVEEAAELPFALVDALPTLGKGEDGLRDAIIRVEEAAVPFSVPVGLLILDNMTRLAAVAGLSTTDPGEYGRILAGIDSLGRLTHAATLTIYHVPVSDRSQSRPAGTYQSTANPDVIMKAERQGSGLTTLIRVAPPYGKSRGAMPPPDVLLNFKVQDVRPWLMRSYEQEGRSVPGTLANAGVEEFTCTGQSDNGSNGTATAALLDATLRESLRQQFTSLVVDREDTQQATSNADRNRPGGEDAELERRVLEALDRHPGAAQATLRAALRGRSTDVDHTVLDLIQRKLVEDRRKGSAHAYYLAAAGRAQLDAAGVRDAADAAETAAILTDLEQGVTGAPKGGP